MNDDRLFRNETDEVLKKIWGLIEKDESGVFVISQNRAREVDACYNALKALLENENKVTFSVTDVMSSAVVIEIKAKSFSVEDPELFADATSLASNYEITPRTDGQMEFNLMFYDYKIKVGEQDE